MNYDRVAATANRLIAANGRPITLYKIDSVVADPSKPWRGAKEQIPQSPVVTIGAFVIGNTSIPTESRGLAFDWVDQELLKQTRHVCIVPAIGLPPLEEYRLLKDGDQQGYQSLLWGQCLQPGRVRLLYVFGVKE